MRLYPLRFYIKGGGVGGSIEDLSNIWIDKSTAPNGPISSLTSKGTTPVTFTLSGSGDDPVMTNNGIEFTGGKFLRATTGLPSGTYKRSTITLDMTLTAPPAATTYAFLLDLQPTGSRSEVRIGWTDNSIPSAGSMLGSNGAGGVNLRNALYKPTGHRFVVSFDFDYITGKMSAIDEDGFQIFENGIDPELMQLGDIRIGQGANMILHRALAIMEEV